MWSAFLCHKLSTAENKRTYLPKCQFCQAIKQIPTECRCLSKIRDNTYNIICIHSAILDASKIDCKQIFAHFPTWKCPPPTDPNRSPNVYIVRNHFHLLVLLCHHLADRSRVKQLVFEHSDQRRPTHYVSIFFQELHTSRALSSTRMTNTNLQIQSYEPPVVVEWLLAHRNPRYPAPEIETKTRKR